MIRTIMLAALLLPLAAHADDAHPAPLSREELEQARGTGGNTSNVIDGSAFAGAQAVATVVQNNASNAAIQVRTEISVIYR